MVAGARLVVAKLQNVIVLLLLVVSVGCIEKWR